MTIPCVIDNQQHNCHFLDMAIVDFSMAVGLTCTGLSEGSCEAALLPDWEFPTSKTNIALITG